MKISTRLLRAMATVAGLTGISRILGFIRDVLTAAILGAGPLADAFFVALKLPNFFRRVTAEGAFSVSFVPIYSKKIARVTGKGSEAEAAQREANLFASRALSFMLLILVPFTLLALWAMPWVIYGLAPGFIGDASRYDLAVELSRITFPYLLLMSMTALLGGVMNAHERFAPFAAAPVLFNCALIAALLWGEHLEFVKTPGHAMAWGVAGAGVLQLLWLVICVSTHGVPKIHLGLTLPKWDEDIRKLFKAMGPGVVGAGVMHINLFIDVVLASLLGAGAISFLYYADRLNQLPLGIVGIAMSAALLPLFSKALEKKNTEEAKGLYNRAMEVCLMLALPAAAALIVVPEALITVLFERGAFTAENTIETSKVLRAYAIGVPAYICMKLLSTAYWAQHDTGSPVKISIIATLLNIVLSLLLIVPLGVAGIALATGLTGWLQCYLLRRGLKNMEAASWDTRFLGNLPKIIGATCLMAAGLAITAQGLSVWFAGTLFEQIAALVILVGGGIALYATALVMFGAVTKEDISGFLQRT